MFDNISAVCLVGQHDHCSDSDGCYCTCHGGAGVISMPVPKDKGPSNYASEHRELVGVAA